MSQRVPPPNRYPIAITTKGTPVVLNVDQPTYADPQIIGGFLRR